MGREFCDNVKMETKMTEENIETIGVYHEKAGFSYAGFSANNDGIGGEPLKRGYVCSTGRGCKNLEIFGEELKRGKVSAEDIFNLGPNSEDYKRVPFFSAPPENHRELTDDEMAGLLKILND